MLNFKIRIMKNIFFILLILLSFSSCFTEQIELDLNEENPKVIIVAWITDLDEPQFVKVSRSTNYLGSVPTPPISDAVVELSNDNNSYILTEQENGSYYLPEDWTAELDMLYTLTVTIEGISHTAQHIMRSCPPMEEVTYQNYTDFQDSLIGYETVFSFQETIGEGDAYYAIDYLKGTMAGDSLLNGGYADDEFIDGDYFDDVTISEEDRLFQIGDTAVIELYSIGRETINYLYDIENEIFRGGPFDPPPANVRTNFDNGALGYFIMSGGQQVEIVIE